MNTPRPPAVGVVDDDESLCRSYGRLLRIAGFEPLTYASAEDFLAVVDRELPACLLVDVQLGGMSGLELQRQLVARKRCPPLIFITAYDNPTALAEATAAGCAGFFHKSDPGERIIAAIRQAVGS
jgi:FixJ family two-component response regulator